MKIEAFYSQSSAENASFPFGSRPFYQSCIHGIKIQSFYPPYPVIYLKAKHIVTPG